MGGDLLIDLPNWNDPIGFLSAADKIGVHAPPGGIHRSFKDWKRQFQESPENSSFWMRRSWKYLLRIFEEGWPKAGHFAITYQHRV